MVNTELKSRIMVFEQKTILTRGSEFLMDQIKFVMDSNNNDTEVPEDQPEEQALQLNLLKDFAYRSKAKAKPQRREPANYVSSIIPTNAGIGLILNQGNTLSLRTKFRRK